MISKENFVKYIDELKKIYDITDGLNKILQKISSNNEIWFDKHETLIVDILQETFDDKENDWIGYALYELDWFERYKDGMITDKDGRNIPLRDASDLYDLLIENIEYK